MSFPQTEWQLSILSMPDMEDGLVGRPGCPQPIMISCGHDGQKSEGISLRKREFQKRAALVLLKKLAEVCAGEGKYPNISVLSRYNSSYFKLRCNGNQIQISIRETGELSYQLTDMLGSTDGRKIYYRYQEKDAFENIIKKFVDDFGRLYKDFLMAGTLHGYHGIDLSYAADSQVELKEFEDFISECM